MCLLHSAWIPDESRSLFNAFWEAAGPRAGTPAAAEQVYHRLGALSRLVGLLTWNVAVRQSGAAGAWRLASGGDNLLGGEGRTSGRFPTPDAPQRRPAGGAASPPLRPYQQINHVGLFDDPSVSHVKGAEFFIYLFCCAPGGEENFISIKERSRALIRLHRKRIGCHNWITYQILGARPCLVSEWKMARSSSGANGAAA